jgi:hypothetical protein
MKAIHKLATIGAMIVVAGASVIALRRLGKGQRRLTAKHKPVELHAHRRRRVENSQT